MAVIEYMLYRVNGGNRVEVPGFVGDRGYWQSPIDKSFIGWVEDDRDYYVPDTIVTLTKAEFVTRQLGIHAHTPFTKEGETPEDERVTMTDAEVTAEAEAWYDSFVASNSEA